ncbi:MAG: tyrosine recombinase XerC [Dehalococcoidales bacterium]|nr:tyrosine recombinase XerC [Dehalococcoidales bacterium]
MQEIFDKYVNSYLQAEKNLSPNTVRNYKIGMRDFSRFLVSKKITSLEFVDKNVIRSYLAYLMKEGIKKGTISGKLSAVRSFFTYLKREEMISNNPVANISSPKLDKRLPAFLTQEEVERLLKTPDLTKPQGLRDRALLELLYASGLRVSELVSLRLDQINPETREIRVIGKGSKERMVLMGLPATRALTEYLNKGRPLLLKDKGSEAVFVNRMGRRIPARRAQKILIEIAKQAGFHKRVYPHLLRHTFATHLLDHDADLRVVQELLGHESPSTTQIYTHVTRAQAKKVYLSAHPMAKEE